MFLSIAVFYVSDRSKYLDLVFHDLPAVMTVFDVLRMTTISPRMHEFHRAMYSSPTRRNIVDHARSVRNDLP